MFEGMPDSQTFLAAGDSVTLQWTRDGVGFGQFTFYMDIDGNIRIDNEIMSKGFIKETLCRLVDNATLKDEVSAEKAERGELKFREFVNKGKT